VASMGNLIKFEIYKLFRDRSLWTLLSILGLLAIFWPIFQYIDNGPDSTTGMEIYLNALGGDNYIVKLAPCILAGFFISSEYSTGVMKSMTASGNSRERIFSAKFFAFSLGTMLITLVYPIFSIGTGTLLFGFGDLPNVQDLQYILRTLGLFMLYGVAFASIMTLIGFLFTDSGKTIGSLLIFFILFDSILYVLSMKFTVLKPVFNYSVFKLFIDASKMSLENGELLKLVLVPMITIFCFISIGMFIFRKKEIK
jgi:ABC-2 type transport system permease protein